MSWSTEDEKELAALIEMRVDGAAEFPTERNRSVHEILQYTLGKIRSLHELNNQIVKNYLAEVSSQERRIKELEQELKEQKG